MEPGSDAAKTCGCICPEIRNNPGVGSDFTFQNRYVIDATCPLHGLAVIGGGTPKIVDWPAEAAYGAQICRVIGMKQPS